MTCLWMAFGAVGLLSNDLVWVARYVLTNPWSTENAQAIWAIWIIISILLAALATLSIGHLLPLGAEAGIEAAEGMLRRINKLKTKTIKLH